MFVKVEDYKEILEVLEMIRERVHEIKQVLDNVKSLRNEEDVELAVWDKSISEIEKKVEGIDKIMFEPEQSW